MVALATPPIHLGDIKEGAGADGRARATLSPPLPPPHSSSPPPSSSPGVAASTRRVSSGYAQVASPPRLIKALARMVVEDGAEGTEEWDGGRTRDRKGRREGPLNYFFLEGSEAGLRLRPFAPWSPRHYSFFTWFCLTDLPSPSPSSSFPLKPRQLLMLTADDGVTLSLSFVPMSAPPSLLPSPRAFAVQLAYRRPKGPSQLITWHRTHSLLPQEHEHGTSSARLTSSESDFRDLPLSDNGRISRDKIGRAHV